MFGNKKDYKIQNPFSGWPRTKVIKNKAGQITAYRVRASYMTPFGAKARFNTLLALILLIFFDMMMTKPPKHDDPNLIPGLIVIVIFIALLWVFLSVFFKTLTMIEFRDKVIRIGRRWKWKNFDRKLPHQFEMVQHDLSEAEAEKLDIERQKEMYKAQMRGRVPYFKKRGKYYTKSFHVIMWYLGQRVDIASVYGKKKAESLLTRLNAIEAMEEITTEKMVQPSAAKPSLAGRRPDPA